MAFFRLRLAIIDSLTLSIVVPAFNEQSRLPATLDLLAAWLSSGPYADAEVLVVDDGSTDDTASVVRRAAAQDVRFRLLQNPGNRGKGYAVRHGMLKAQGQWVLFTDADLSAPIGELPKLFEAGERTGAAVAIGSRALNRQLIGVHQQRWRELSGMFFNRVMRLITGLPFADTQCGFKLYRRDAAQRIFGLQKIDGFGFDVEDLFIAKRLGYVLTEVSVRWNNAEGTKVSTLAGIKSFVDLLAIRWNGLTGKYNSH